MIVGPAGVALTQAGGAQASHELAAVDRYGTCGQCTLAFSFVNVVVVALKRRPSLADRRSEAVQLLVALVGDEVRPASTSPWPSGLVNEDGHDCLSPA